ncbi:TPA: hypothetical protein ACJI3N_004072 [Raoultella planticola]
MLNELGGVTNEKNNIPYFGGVFFVRSWNVHQNDIDKEKINREEETTKTSAQDKKSFEEWQKKVNDETKDYISSYSNKDDLINRLSEQCHKLALEDISKRYEVYSEITADYSADILVVQAAMAGTGTAKRINDKMQFSRDQINEFLSGEEKRLYSLPVLSTIWLYMGSKNKRNYTSRKCSINFNESTKKSMLNY